MRSVHAKVHNFTRKGPQENAHRAERVLAHLSPFSCDVDVHLADAAQPWANSFSQSGRKLSLRFLLDALDSRSPIIKNNRGNFHGH